jgi:hypothetical protein
MEPTYQEFEESILHALAEATDNQGGGLFDLQTLAERKDMQFENQWIDEAYMTLDEKGFIQIIAPDNMRNKAAKITDDGRLEAGKFWLNYNSEISV